MHEKEHRFCDSDPSFVLGKTLSGLRIPCLDFGADATCLVSLLWGLHEKIQGKCLSQCRAHGKCLTYGSFCYYRVLGHHSQLFQSLLTSLYLPNSRKWKGQVRSSLLSKVVESGRTQPWASAAPLWAERWCWLWMSWGRFGLVLTCWVSFSQGLLSPLCLLAFSSL